LESQVIFIHPRDGRTQRWKRNKEHQCVESDFRKAASLPETGFGSPMVGKGVRRTKILGKYPKFPRPKRSYASSNCSTAQCKGRQVRGPRIYVQTIRRSGLITFGGASFSKFSSSSLNERQPVMEGKRSTIRVSADQRGHGLGVSLGVYSISDLEQKIEAATKLEAEVLAPSDSAEIHG
jgi:hypothetical protein